MSLTTLHPFADHILKMQPRWLRVWLAGLLTLALTTMPLPMAGAFLWTMVAAYMTVTETLARMISAQHRVRRRLEAECEGHLGLLAERDARIVALEADLVRARSASTVCPETAEQAIFRKVGLHPKAPDFVVHAARRAFRMALHPDKHPRHAQHAHERYLRAQSIFDEIERLRA